MAELPDQDQNDSDEEDDDDATGIRRYPLAVRLFIVFAVCIFAWTMWKAYVAVSCLSKGHSLQIRGLTVTCISGDKAKQ
jgi:hypothetical protein